MRTLVPLLAVLTVAAAPAEAKKPAHLQSHGGYATTELVVIRGRVARGAASADAPGRSRSRKVWATARAFAGRDVEHARVRVEGGGVATTVRADDDGFFEARLTGRFDAGRQRFELRLDDRKYAAPPLALELEVVDGRRGVVVVSDLDDTLIATGVTGSKAGLVARIAASDAHDIRPIGGAAEALAAFAAEGVPIVYLTASPVELAPRLTRFLELRGFPPGALFLRHYEDDGIGDPTRYKRARFATILADFPGRELVLFGDNGEKDVEIFRALAASTGRVRTAYVRRTLPHPAPEGVVLFDGWPEVVAHARQVGTLGRVLRTPPSGR